MVITRRYQVNRGLTSYKIVDKLIIGSQLEKEMTEVFTRPSILNLNRKLLERKAREQILEMEASPEEKLIAYEDFMEKIELYLKMEETERLAV